MADIGQQLYEALYEAADILRVYRQLNRVEKGNWTRLSRVFSIAHANKVWETRLENRK